jgi:hypothetical protein
MSDDCVFIMKTQKKAVNDCLCSRLEEREGGKNGACDKDRDLNSWFSWRAKKSDHAGDAMQGGHQLLPTHLYPHEAHGTLCAGRQVRHLLCQSGGLLGCVDTTPAHSSGTADCIYRVRF